MTRTCKQPFCHTACHRVGQEERHIHSEAISALSKDTSRSAGVSSSTSKSSSSSAAVRDYKGRNSDDRRCEHRPVRVGSAKYKGAKRTNRSSSDQETKSTP